MKCRYKEPQLAILDVELHRIAAQDIAYVF